MDETTLTPIIDASTGVDYTADIIFVHGLGGDGMSTWSAGDAPVYHFPKLLLDDLETMRVWVLDYPAHKTKWTEKGSSMGLYDRALNVTDVLITENIGDRPIFFICHSLGGLLVKKIIRLSFETTHPEIKKIARNTKGIAFIATPHRGANLGNIAGYIDKMFLKLPRFSELVDELQAGAPALRELDDFYREKNEELGIKTAAYRENIKLKGLFMVVDEISSDPLVTGCTTFPMDADHEMICKPVNGKKTQIYRSIKHFVEETPASSRQAKPPRPAHEVLLEKYLQQLIAGNQRLQFSGIPGMAIEKDTPLSAVFVMQRMTPGVPFQDNDRLMRERGENDVLTNADSRSRQNMNSSNKRSSGENKKPVRFDDIFEHSHHRRFVLLGNPGSGKSTLLKHLMLEAAQKLRNAARNAARCLLPIFVKIREFDKALSESRKPGYNLRDYLYEVMKRNYDVPLPHGFFEEYLDRGRALLLFDGLDEVAPETRRAEVRRLIEAFITGCGGDNKVVVTSRTAGYGRTPLSTADYRHFTLEDFNGEEIRLFLRQWCRHRGMDRPGPDDFKAVLDAEPAVGELAGNPLLLTIIAGIHRPGAPLPNDRLLLYETASEALLNTWDTARHIIDDTFNAVEKRHFLEKIAFQLQTLEKGQTADAVMERDELHDALLADFQRVFQKESFQAKPLVDQFLKVIRTRTGLLVEISPDQYGFVHKIFQEYFAAEWMVQNSDEEHFLRLMDTYADNPFWRETLLLALRVLPRKRAPGVLEHISDRDPNGIEAYLHLGRYFVMKFIGAHGSRLDNRSFVEARVREFFDVSWNEGKDRSYYSMKTMERFKQWVSTVADGAVRAFLSRELLSLAEDGGRDGVLRQYCAEMAGDLGEREKAVEVLLSLARDETRDGWLRYRGASAAGRLGDKEAAMQILLALTADLSRDSRLRRECATTVGKLGDKDKAMDILFTIARDGAQDGWLRRECAYIAGGFGDAAGAEAMDILLAFAEDETQPGWMRRESAANAAQLGDGDKTAMKRLLILAQDDAQSADLRRICAYAVGKRDFNVNALTILLGILRDDGVSGYQRRACAEAVGDLGVLNTAEVAVDGLRDIAADNTRDGYLRHACAGALGKLGETSGALEILLGMAGDGNQAGYLRRACAESAGNLGEKTKALDILLSIARDARSGGGLRRQCAEVIGKLGDKETAVALLADLYRSQRDHYTDAAREIYNALWELTEI